MRYNENTLLSWTLPLSSTEEARVENTVRMIKDAINKNELLSNYVIEVFAQGSYANNTNVKQNSEIDICAMLKSVFYPKYVEGMEQDDYGHSSSQFTFFDFKSEIIKSLEFKFGVDSISVGNKCININANTYHVNADIVPCLQYRNYAYIKSYIDNKYIEGIKFFTSYENKEVVNYPKVHNENGISKNNNTNYKYKKMVRIIKRIRNNMFDEGLKNETISSYLLECLVWNVPEIDVNLTLNF